MTWKSRPSLRDLAKVSALFFLTVQSVQAGQVGGQTPDFRAEIEVVRVPVVVVDEQGRLYTDLSRERFTILENGKPQEIVHFEGGETPLTIVLLLEYSNVVRFILGEVVRPAGIFVSQVMEGDDFAAIVAYDLRPRVLADFTRNRQQLLDEVHNLLRSAPTFSESNLFDALEFVLMGGTVEDLEYAGLSRVEGRTGVILVSTGIDTMSRLTFDQARRVVEGAGVPIYSVAVGELALMRAEPHMTGAQRLTILQARNQLRTFSESSAGRSYVVRFPRALDDVLASIASMLRFQYVLGYRPSEPTRADERREIEVLVDVTGDGQPDNERLDLQFRRYYTAGSR